MRLRLSFFCIEINLVAKNGHFTSPRSATNLAPPVSAKKSDSPIVVIDNYDSFTYNLCQVSYRLLVADSVLGYWSILSYDHIRYSMAGRLSLGERSRQVPKLCPLLERMGLTGELALRFTWRIPLIKCGLRVL